MKSIRIKCPAKINLDLRVFPKDPKTGYHPIKSIMQTISLFDFLTITLDDGSGIVLSGNSDEIPYNEDNICYKAAQLILDEIKEDYKVTINIEKNIPVCAGLAGGSTDGAGVLFGLNKLLGEVLSWEKLNELALKLGSDLNFCLVGGTKICTGRGEKMITMPFYDFKLSLIKPKDLKISAREAYEAFDNLNIESDMRNDLEFALLKTKKYPQLEYLTKHDFQMSGSGPTYFLRDKDIKLKNKDYLVINGLNSVNHGVTVVD